MEKLLFLPVPREIKIANQFCNVPSHAGFFISGIDDKNYNFFSEYIKKISQRFTKSQWKLNHRHPFFTLVCDDSLNIPKQGYKLTVSHDSIKAESSDASGAYYALCTLKQILIQKTNRLPVLTIEDYPDFKHRGVMIDISRSKVPKMETLFNLIDLLSGWKINQLQLYTEHTFAYKGHEIVWQGCSPITAEEIRKLDDYCKQRFVELVPNQNSFGHFHRWLQHPQYRHLAEDTDHPYTLCPIDSGSIQLLEDLYQQLLPNFSSNQFNVGCDETVVGKRSADAVKKKGEGRVYLEFLLKIYQLVKKHGKTMQFWGDIIQNHPELIPELPDDVIVLEWGYESDHPFKARCEKITKSGLPFYVCPGTSAWNSIAGRTENAIANLTNAARNGIETGAIGLLNTDWGDNGHWQYLPVSYIGFGFGAGVSWCLKSNLDMPVEKTIGLLAFDDSSFHAGHFAYELGNVSTATGIHVSNASPLFCCLLELTTEIPQVALWMRKKGIEMAEQQIEKAMSFAKKMKIENDENILIRDEFENAAKLLKHACTRAYMMIERYSYGKEFSKKLISQLIKDAEQIISQHKQLWLKRNRAGGLEESTQLLEKYTVNQYREILKS